MSNKLTLRILDKAEEDMSLIATCIAKDNSSAAVDLLKQFYVIFDTLSKYPNLGLEEKISRMKM